MTAYYNEIDQAAAAWLRELIKAGHIAPGIVDERSIEDVFPDDLRGFTQCHFFAGIGVWSYALRQAGWTDDRPVWTGSCPCQPFSAAGKGAGFADERHLWPAFHHLIRQCRPAIVLGEQVASNDGLAWFDLVQADLEGEGYACAAVDTCAAGFGAPHIRQRLYWMGRSNNEGSQGRTGMPERADKCPAGQNGMAGWIANTNERPQHGRLSRSSQRPAEGRDTSCGVDNTDVERCNGEHALLRPRETGRDAEQVSEIARTGEHCRPGPTNGFWGNADWLLCRDGKWRSVEPGTFPLAYGAAARVVRLRGYGNAIVAPQAQAFIGAVMQTD